MYPTNWKTKNDDSIFELLINIIIMKRAVSNLKFSNQLLIVFFMVPVPVSFELKRSLMDIIDFVLPGNISFLNCLFFPGVSCWLVLVL